MRNCICVCVCVDDDSSEDSSNEGSVSSFSKGKYILPADDFEITTKFEMVSIC